MSDSKTEVKVTSQLDYNAKAYLQTSYTLQKISPASGTQNVSLSIAGGDQPVDFYIPALKCWNPAESILCWDFTIPAQAAGRSTYTPADTIPELRTIQLFNSANKMLVNIEDLNVYLQLIRRKETPLHELMTMDSTDGLESCDCAAADNFTPSGVVSDRSYVDPLNLYVSGVATAITLHRKLKLGYILNSFLASNKDYVFPEMLTLRLGFNGGRVAWSTDAANDAKTNAAALTLEYAANPISKLSLYLAAETNNDIVNTLKGKVAAGMQVPIMYTWRLRCSPAASDYQTVTLNLGPSHGRSLHKVIHAIYPLAETKNQMYDHNNYGANDNTAAKVTQYSVSIDSVKTTQFDINCTINAGEDWMIHRNRLKGSSIVSHRNYSLNWFAEEDFTNSGSPDHTDNKDDSLIKGKDLSNGIKYEFVGSSMINAQYNHYDFVIVQRQLIISPQFVDVN